MERVFSQAVLAISLSSRSGWSEVVPLAESIKRMTLVPPLLLVSVVLVLGAGASLQTCNSQPQCRTALDGFVSAAMPALNTKAALALTSANSGVCSGFLSCEILAYDSGQSLCRDSSLCSCFVGLSRHVECR
jgi:hypothetical protein